MAATWVCKQTAPEVGYSQQGVALVARNTQKRHGRTTAGIWDYGFSSIASSSKAGSRMAEALERLMVSWEDLRETPSGLLLLELSLSFLLLLLYQVRSRCIRSRWARFFHAAVMFRCPLGSQLAHDLTVQRGNGSCYLPRRNRRVRQPHLCGNSVICRQFLRRCHRIGVMP